MQSVRGDIFVISDLHVGDGGARDNFEAGRKTTELRAFLDWVGSEGGELFVLGDLFELWQVSLSRLFAFRRELLDHLATLPLVYVPGNHDIDLAHFVGTDFLSHPFFQHMRGPFVRTLGKKTFRFSHGHEVDPFNAGDDPGFGRMLAIFAGIFEDQNGSPFLATGESAEDVLEQFGESMLTLWTAAMTTIGRRRLGKEMLPTDTLTPAQNPDRLSEHIAAMRAHRDAHSYDVAVVGHTHKPGRIDDWYFNSGSWVGARNSLLRIGPEGDVRYFEWSGRRATEHAMPIVVATKPRPAKGGGKHPFEVPLAAARALFPRPERPERSRWVLLAQGCLALIVALAAFVIGMNRGPSVALRGLVVAFATYAIIDGALSLFGAMRETPVRALLFRVRGVASVVLGLVAFRRGYAIEVFVLLLGLWAFVTGVLRIAASRIFRRWVDARWLLVVGLGSMVGGLFLLLMPTSPALLKYGFSTYLAYYGLGEIFAAVFGQRRAPGRSIAARSPAHA